MKHKIDYYLISADESDSNERDVRKLKCIIDDKKIIIFEFTRNLLADKIISNLNEKSSAEDFYKAIEKFLNQKLDNNNLKDRYQIN